MKQLYWPLVGFENAQLMTGITAKAKSTKYPMRLMRYWFAACALRELHQRLNRPLRVLEVGVDVGDMLCFLGGKQSGAELFALPDWIERWDGVDVQADRNVLNQFSYSEFIEANIEKDGDWQHHRQYDAILTVHILEHLLEPEAALNRLATMLVPGGILCGGSPTMPSALAMLHEPYLRRKNAKAMHDVRIHKHLSVITPQRIRSFCATKKWEISLLAGAFLVRSSGSPLENLPGWIRANLLWGALFPSLGGEIYFSLDKPTI